MALTIRTTAEQDTLILQLCKRLEVKTASKLLIRFLEDYNLNNNMINSQQKKIGELLQENKKLKNVISSHQSSLTDFLNFEVN